MILERFKVPKTDEVRVSEAALRQTVSAIFTKVGVSSEDAAERRLGVIVAPKAMRLAMEKAKHVGVGVVSM